MTHDPTPPPPADGSPVGLVLAGRYRITAPLGQGRASTVYLAGDLRLAERQVALKVARVDRHSTQTSRARVHLVNEARALAALRHPALPSLADVLMHGNHYALVLEYLPGRSLREVAGGWPVVEAEILDWSLRLCDALVYLHGNSHLPVTHGALDAGHCILLPQGRLVLFDFGTAAPAAEPGRRQDTRALAALLYQLLLGDAPTAETAPPAAGAALDATRILQKPEIPQTPLHAVLRQAASGAPLTAAALRARLLDVARDLDLPWGVCPSCQSRVRIQARYCGVCGGAIRHESGRAAAPPAPGTTFLTPPPTAAPPPAVAAPPDSAVPARQALAGTAPLRFPASARAVGQTARLILPYSDRLRAVGRYLDEHRLRRVTVVESGAEFFVRGHTEGGPPLADVPPGTVASATLNLEDLVELDEQARRHRTGEQKGPRRQARSLVGNLLFPRGYEGPLRALGVELDALRGVSLVSLVDTGASLYLDYDRTGDDLPAGVAHQHLALSASDLEAMTAAAVARRRVPDGHTLSAMIQRARER